jgi:phosphonoacetaldehyde reductase
VALTIGAMLRYNAQVTSTDCVDRRRVDHVRASIDQLVGLLGVSTVEEAAARLDRLIASIGCPTTLSQVGAKEVCDVEQVAAQVNAERLSNNPRRLDRASTVALLTGLL